MLAMLSRIAVCSPCMKSMHLHVLEDVHGLFAVDNPFFLLEGVFSWEVRPMNIDAFDQVGSTTKLLCARILPVV